VSFTLVVEPEDPSAAGDQDMTGHFELLGTTDTRFSTDCEKPWSISSLSLGVFIKNR